MYTYSSIIFCSLLCLLATVQTQEDVSLTGSDLESTSKPLENTSDAEPSTAVLVGNNYSAAATGAVNNATTTYITTSEYIYKQVTDVPWSDLKGLILFFTCLMSYF